MGACIALPTEEHGIERDTEYRFAHSVSSTVASGLIQRSVIDIGGARPEGGGEARVWKRIYHTELKICDLVWL